MFSFNFKSITKGRRIGVLIRKFKVDWTKEMCVSLLETSLKENRDKG